MRRWVVLVLALAALTQLVGCAARDASVTRSAMPPRVNAEVSVQRLQSDPVVDQKAAEAVAVAYRSQLQDTYHATHLLLSFEPHRSRPVTDGVEVSGLLAWQSIVPSRWEDGVAVDEFEIGSAAAPAPFRAVVKMDETPPRVVEWDDPVTPSQSSGWWLPADSEWGAPLETRMMGELDAMAAELMKGKVYDSVP